MIKSLVKLTFLFTLVSGSVSSTTFLADIILNGIISKQILNLLFKIIPDLPIYIVNKLYFRNVLKFEIASKIFSKTGISMDINLFPHLAIFVTTFIFITIFSCLFTEKMILRRYKAKKFESEDIEEVLEFEDIEKIAKNLVKKAKLKVSPKILVIDTPTPNAFVVGKTKRPSIVLTRGLIDLLDKDELRAVLSHELIQTKDLFVKSVVALFAGILISLSTVAYWLSLLTGFGQEDDPAPNLIKLFVMSLVAPIAAFIIRLMVNPYKYSIDLESLELHKNRGKLIDALRKIEESKPEFDINPAHLHLFFAVPDLEEYVDILDFKIPTYSTLFSCSPLKNRVEFLNGNLRNERVKIAKPIFFSFISYIFVLFAIIAFDTFNRKDFDFMRATLISSVYLTILLLFFTIFFIVFRFRRFRLI